MGNFSISHYARFDIRPERIELTYALDFAEIPTFELLQSWNLDGRDRDAVIARATTEAPRWLSGLRIMAGGRQVAPRTVDASAVVQEGAGGLPVLRVTITAALPALRTIEYEDLNYPSRTGWKEIVIAPHGGVRIAEATQGAEDRSRALELYPSDATVAPPQDVKASFHWSPSATAPSVISNRPATQPQPRAAVVALQPSRPIGAVVRGDFLSRMLGGAAITPAMMLIGIAVAFGLGAMHALSPGHGKTIVAAWLVGSRGTIRHAILLGAIVTFTHTAAVFALGAGVLFFQRYIVPEKVIPVLSAVSGISIVFIGASLLYQRSRTLAHQRPHDHHHHDHDSDHHHHHGHTHDHHPHGHAHAPDGNVSLASLVALGISGGLVPCPSALVLLLSAIALGRTSLGMILLVAFSAGLALVLMAIGIAVLFAKNLLPSRSPLSGPALRYLPVVSAALVTIIGLLMTGVSLGLMQAGRFVQ
jgi:ABC-type nickel/cobalt efflux system permease component RcnA